MARIDYDNPDPERGIFGCAHAAKEYGKARSELPVIAAAIDSLSRELDRVLTQASSTYYTSTYGPTGVFRASARGTIERLEMLQERMVNFVDDMRANFLQESIVPDERSFSFFLSYSHSDVEFARRFADDLRQMGHQVWRDEENIRLGETIRRSIEAGIDRAQFLIFLLSKSSVTSEWCQRELDIALERETAENIVVLPVVIEDCNIPATLRTKRYLKIENYNDGLNRFLSMLPVDDTG